ncbi:PleD family two-component system response regulator [Magnetospira sp. QH-2]|uniref:PleD family two-component system response regulator n=1 Tax=Magnetospira sp. (strain QH-2) TaxID=1288970 RepID=UPI0003E80FFB|nr:PleD family two-component system response regulator [Magnetospira sp. QH-2]CCQ75163.1 Response regulator receiver modulated diguanylate cyclase [Magnetospira sp. QH-2]
MSARVLIVDDMMPSVRMLGAKLSSEYYDVVTATDGPSALEIIENQPPDLVLLDAMMPGMDGFEVCRQIKGNGDTAYIPVIMVTALSETDDRVRALENGADDFLTKPVDDLNLFARVRSMIRMKQLLDQWRLREETSRELGLPPNDILLNASDGNNANVVVVENSQIEARSLGEAMSEDGHNTVFIDTVTEACGSMVFQEADLAIISLDVDDEDPLRLCSILRSAESTRHLPILLVGGEHDMARLVRALDLGVNDYLLRPLERVELKARVRSQIRRKRYQERLRTNFLQNLSLAVTDTLTGLHNRRYLESHMETLVKRAEESGRPLSILMIDIDHFKRVNDDYGHPAGDAVLRELANRIARSLRGFDLVTRYGGEEFLTLMPDTDIKIATGVATRLCEQIAAETVALPHDLGETQITVSIGVTKMKTGSETADEFIQRVDEALYKAKEQGRNQVVVA